MNRENPTFALATITAFLTVSLTISGCSSDNRAASIKSVESIVEKNNQAAINLDSKTKHVSLSLKRIDHDVFEIRLKNAGDEITVIRPMWGYTVRIHFFDNSGKNIIPRTLIAVQLPALDSGSITTLPKGQELSGTVFRSHILEQYGDLESCKVIAVSYLPSQFALEPSSRKPMDLTTAAVWSNPLEW